MNDLPLSSDKLGFGWLGVLDKDVGPGILVTVAMKSVVERILEVETRGQLGNPVLTRLTVELVQVVGFWVLPNSVLHLLGGERLGADGDE